MANPNRTVWHASRRMASTPEQIAQREASREARREPFWDWMFNQARGGRVFSNEEEAREVFAAEEGKAK